MPHEVAPKWRSCFWPNELMPHKRSKTGLVKVSGSRFSGASSNKQTRMAESFHMHAKSYRKGVKHIGFCRFFLCRLPLPRLLPDLARWEQETAKWILLVVSYLSA